MTLFEYMLNIWELFDHVSNLFYVDPALSDPDIVCITDLALPAPCDDQSDIDS